MKRYSGFADEGKWYKGNLHTHSDVSDGILPQKEIAEMYRAKKYSFLAFTDHVIATNPEEYNTNDFLIVPGIEMHTINRYDQNRPERFQTHHVVGIQCGIPSNEEEVSSSLVYGEKVLVPEWDGIGSGQSIIDYLNKRNCFAIYAHPVWSRLELNDFINLQGYSAMEIYNNTCETRYHTGHAEIYWDSLLRRGRRIWGIASDDMHHKTNDAFGGWVVVKAKGLTIPEITEALKKGDFYSSSGPEIYRYEVLDGEVHIECSPVKAIHFVTYEPLGRSFIAEEGGLLTSATYRLRGSEKYVRVECVDINGNKAWSNPIFYEMLQAGKSV